MKNLQNLHRFWTSMSAIFGFTFDIGRMTEVLTPDIYRAHCIRRDGNSTYKVGVNPALEN